MVRACVTALGPWAILLSLLAILFAPAILPADPAASDKAAPATPKPSPTAVAPEPADNSYCLVCHTNYEEEKLTSVHQPVGVGCEKCHGISDRHSADEDNITPPDRMFTKTEVNAFCLTCHAKEKLAKDTDHREFLAAQSEADDTCTECHGKQHRLKVRTRVWDKRTGKLVSDDGVRMMEPSASSRGGK